jgi:hypothetical protein
LNGAAFLLNFSCSGARRLVVSHRPNPGGVYHMHVVFRSASIVWIALLLGASAYLIRNDLERARRIDAVNATDADDRQTDASSPTGYAHGRRWYIVPEHNNRSYEWIAQTQRLFAEHRWRLRWTETENAPEGHALHAPSLYRWWLAGVTRSIQAASSLTPGLAAERAALWADPVLHLAVLLLTTAFVARRWGSLAALVAAVVLATTFPFSAIFAPGVPDDQGLTRVFALWILLTLFAATNSPRRNRWIAISGALAGLTLWANAAAGLTLLLGMAVGALGFCAIRLAGRHEGGARSGMNWRLWSLVAAATSLVGYLVEFFPGHFDFELRVNHPVYGLALLGVGDILHVCEGAAGARAWRFTAGAIVRLLLGIAAIAALPISLAVTQATWPWLADPYAGRLTFLPNGVIAPNFVTWIARDGVTLPLLATVAPVAFAVLGLVAWRRTKPDDRLPLAIGFGLVMVALVAATRFLAWWSFVDVPLIALAIVATAGARDASRVLKILTAIVTLAVVALGVAQMRPLPSAPGSVEFTRAEVEGLLERRLSHWLAQHTAGPAVVVLPPDRTTSWCFHGGMRGLGSTSWENRAGIEATVKIVTALSVDEAEAQVRAHGVTHIVLPSWDNDLDEFARWSVKNPEQAFVSALHRWTLPTWLRPIPYRLPVVAGFEDQSIAIFQVTNDTSRAVSLARLGEYFVEVGELTAAAGVQEALQRYPADLSCLVTRAEIAKARGDAAGFAQAVEAVQASVNGGFDRTLPWDRRVSLAVVLAMAEKQQLAATQLQRCLPGLDATRLRTLTTASLYRLMVLSKALQVPLGDPALKALARELLPAELQSIAQ